MPPVSFLSDLDPIDPTLPRQLRFPGQAGAPPGPVDLCAMYLAHHGFRRDLDAFVLAIDATPLGDRVAWPALSRRWSVFADLLRHHQQAEDLGVWHRLRERADAEQRALLWALEAEHDEIDPLLRECRQGFLWLSEDQDAGRLADLRLGLLAARERIRSHLDHEERLAMPVVQQRLSDEQWRRIERDHFRTGVPVNRLAALTAWALHQVPDELKTAVFLRSGPVTYVRWRVTRRRFEAAERLAFRYLVRSPAPTGDGPQWGSSATHVR